MDVSTSSSRLSRQTRLEDSEHWDCSVCTYQNTPKAFKCQMCDTRKGTSTRKPRISQQHVASQNASPKHAGNSTKKEKRQRQHHAESSNPIVARPPRLKNIDRSTAQHMAVTIGDVTVIITDYKPLSDEVSEDCTDLSTGSSGNDSCDTGTKSY